MRTNPIGRSAMRFTLFVVTAVPLALLLRAPVDVATNQESRSSMIRVDYNSESPGCRQLAVDINDRLADEGFGTQLVYDRNTGVQRANLFRFVERADREVGEMLRVVLGGGISRDVFDEIQPWSGDDVGAAEAQVLIHLYAEGCE